jgi:hypothetical protein
MKDFQPDKYSNELDMYAKKTFQKIKLCRMYEGSLSFIAVFVDQTLFSSDSW